MASTPSSPIAFSASSLVGKPICGAWSSFQSPVWKTLP
jgi:hypothetical protein